jgi:hypothetical protein
MKSATMFTTAGCSARPRVVMHAGSEDLNLTSSQLAKLQRAARQGRRHVKVCSPYSSKFLPSNHPLITVPSVRRVQIEQLSQEVELNRSDVIQWLKDNPAPQISHPLDDDSETEAEFPSASGRDDDRHQPSAAAPRQQQATSARPKLPQPTAASQAHLPPWKRYAQQKKQLGRQAEKTLEMIFARTEWPNDDVVASMWDLHRMNKLDVVKWFQERRRETRGGSRERRRGGAAPTPPVAEEDADAAWDTQWKA